MKFLNKYNIGKDNALSRIHTNENQLYKYSRIRLIETPVNRGRYPGTNMSHLAFNTNIFG